MHEGVERSKHSFLNYNSPAWVFYKGMSRLKGVYERWGMTATELDQVYKHLFISYVVNVQTIHLLTNFQEKMEILGGRLENR